MGLEVGYATVKLQTFTGSAQHAVDDIGEHAKLPVDLAFMLPQQFDGAMAVRGIQGK
jgi:hypothetical protein